MDSEREKLGRIVRDAWLRWADTQLFPKSSWLLTWEELDDEQREVDMQIGEAVSNYVLQGLTEEYWSDVDE